MRIPVEPNTNPQVIHTRLVERMRPRVEFYEKMWNDLVPSHPIPPPYLDLVAHIGALQRAAAY
jgi:hypothetical protein